MYRGSKRGYTFGSFTLFFHHLGEVRGQTLVKGEMIIAGFVTMKSLIYEATTLSKTDTVVLPPCPDLVF